MTDPANPEQLVEHFFRRESAGLVSLLARRFGFGMIDLVEDMVQEALAEALRSWRLGGVPDNPAAWLHRVAKNRIIDALRRDQTHASAVEQLAFSVADQDQQEFEAEEIEDSQLRMIFACCHPTLDRRSQLALTLKVLCGLGDHEIARGLLMTREAVKKRITRAKQQLQQNRVSLELPGPMLRNERLDAVHDVIYLMFNEGYSSTRGEVVVRIDLCEEAARLCHLLCEAEAGSPTTRALLALMLFHAARFESRMNPQGETVLLGDQDRSRWDRDMMHVAEYWLTRSATGNEVSRFHLEAGIARLHCNADSLNDTNWAAILRHYEMLAELFPSPMYDLNRAIVLGRLDQVQSAFELLRGDTAAALSKYPLFHCVKADLYSRCGQTDNAVDSWRLALQHVKSEHERQIIKQRIASLSSSRKVDSKGEQAH